MIEMFVGRMRMSFDEYENTEIIVLFIAFKGWNKQRHDEIISLRSLVVEQTVELINISGKMVKNAVSMRDFGVDIGPNKELTPEQIKEKIKTANSIQWKVGNK